jgi:hypothetical protein
MMTNRTSFILLALTACAASAACGGDPASVGLTDVTTIDTEPTEPDARALHPDAAVDAAAPEDANAAPACGAKECGANLYCSRAEFACGGGGTCAPRPSACPSDAADLQCGCDNHTYVSACNAAAAGVSVKHAGSCNVKNGQEVSCKLNEHCGATQYCHFIGTCGTGGSGLGLCKERPLTCAPPGNYQSCGCDGTTYASVCEAAKAGVSTKGIAPCSP